MESWIGVAVFSLCKGWTCDLDGEVNDDIVRRIKALLTQGKDVRVSTCPLARGSQGPDADPGFTDRMKDRIVGWCRVNLGTVLPVDPSTDDLKELLITLPSNAVHGDGPALLHFSSPGTGTMEWLN